MFFLIKFEEAIAVTGFRVFTIAFKTLQIANGTHASLVWLSLESLLSKKVCLYKNKKNMYDIKLYISGTNRIILIVL